MTDTFNVTADLTPELIPYCSTITYIVDSLDAEAV